MISASKNILWHFRWKGNLILYVRTVLTLFVCLRLDLFIQAHSISYAAVIFSITMKLPNVYVDGSPNSCLCIYKMIFPFLNVLFPLLLLSQRAPLPMRSLLLIAPGMMLSRKTVVDVIKFTSPAWPHGCFHSYLFQAEMPPRVPLQFKFRFQCIQCPWRR